LTILDMPDGGPSHQAVDFDNNKSISTKKHCCGDAMLDAKRQGTAPKVMQGA
jgi:hypothetical protein